MGMFSAVLRRNIRYSSFEHLQQRLLHALTGHIASDGRILILSSDLVDLIYIDDAALGSFDIARRVLDQTQDDVFHVLADVAGFGQRGRINNGKRYAQQTRQRLCEKRLACSCRADQQDVGLLKFDVRLFAGQLDALVVIVDRDSKLLLGFILADDILIEESLNLGWFGKVNVFRGWLVILIFIDDVLTNPNAFVTDEDGRPRDQFPDVILTLVAKRTSQDVVTVFLQLNSSPLSASCLSRFAETHD